MAKKKNWLLIIAILYLSQVINFHIRGKGCRDFPGGQVAETPCSQWRGPINKRFHMLQLKPGVTK